MLRGDESELTSIRDEMLVKTGACGITIQSGYKNLLKLIQIIRLKKKIWPSFLYGLKTQFLEIITVLMLPTYNYVIINDDNGEIIAVLNTLPLYLQSTEDLLPETGYDFCIQNSFKCYLSKKNMLSAISVATNEAYQGKGLSSVFVKLIRFAAKEHGFKKAIIPIRPPLKAKYCDESMEEFLLRKNSEGEVIDPWLRVHLRQGAILRNVCYRSMSVKAHINTWQKFSSEPFSSSGQYKVHGGLTLLSVDKHSGVGTYVEPNIWVEHVV